MILASGSAGGASFTESWLAGQRLIVVKEEKYELFTTRNGYDAAIISQVLSDDLPGQRISFAIRSNDGSEIVASGSITNVSPSKKMTLSDAKKFVDAVWFKEVAGGSTAGNQVELDFDKPTPSGNGNSTDSGNYDQIVTITCGDTMQHDVKSFEVKSGTKVKLVLKHSGTLPKIAMGHNLILLKKGKTALSFGQETLAAGGNASNPLPEAVKIDVIANTKLLGPGESDSFIFTAPSELGTYEYLCTFPGHFAMERGLMTVTQGPVSIGNNENQNSSSSNPTSNTNTIDSVFFFCGNG